MSSVKDVQNLWKPEQLTTKKLLIIGAVIQFLALIFVIKLQYIHISVSEIALMFVIFIFAGTICLWAALVYPALFISGYIIIKTLEITQFTGNNNSLAAGILLHGAEPILIIALLFLALKRFSELKKFHFSVFFLLIALFCLVASLSAIINHSGFTDLLWGLYYVLRYSFLYLYIIWSELDTKVIARLLLILGILALGEALLGLSQSLYHFYLGHIIHTEAININHNGVTFSYKPNGTMSTGFNTFSEYIVMALILLIGVVGFKNRKYFIITTAGLALGILILMITSSRESLGFLVVGLLTIAWLRKPELRKKMLIAASLLIVLYLAAFIGINSSGIKISNNQSTISGKIMDLFSPSILSPAFDTNVRLFLLVHGSQVIVHHNPLLGFGPGTFGSPLTVQTPQFYTNIGLKILTHDKGSFFAADVGWVVIFGQFGLLGLSIYLSLIIYMIKILHKIYSGTKGTFRFLNNLSAATIGIFTGFIFVMFFSPPFEIQQTSIYFWFLYSVCVALYHSQVKEHEKIPAYSPSRYNV